MRISDWSSDVCLPIYPARDLRGRPHFAREQLDLLGIAAIGLMRREHVVICGNDADIHRGAGAAPRLILARSGKAVPAVAARPVAAVGPGFAPAVSPAHISGAAPGVAGRAAVGAIRDCRAGVSPNSK